LLHLLEKKFPPKRRILGGGVGLALVISAAMFALIHLPKDGDPRALATFFPGLLFGWMRSATGSILGSTITHGCSNILIRLLDLSVLR
jgi:membrane protease YdiL (CAAX protease family)